MAVNRVTLSPGCDLSQQFLDPDRLSKQLDEMRVQGFDVVENFAPPEGGWSFRGPDAFDRYRIDPRADSMDDFRRLVRTAHAIGLATITFDNPGFSTVEAQHLQGTADR